MDNNSSCRVVHIMTGTIWIEIRCLYVTERAANLVPENWYTIHIIDARAAQQTGRFDNMKNENLSCREQRDENRGPETAAGARLFITRRSRLYVIIYWFSEKFLAARRKKNGNRS